MVILRDLLAPQNSVLFAFVCNIKALVMGCGSFWGGWRVAFVIADMLVEFPVVSH